MKKLNVLITSGGTKVPIDSVRHIGNMSSGTFGAKIGYEALRAGHDVTFLMAKDSKSPLGLRFDEHDSDWKMLRKVARNLWDRFKYRNRIRLVEYSTFQEYERYLWNQIRCYGDYDVVVLAAAVSDYDVVNKVDGKLRTKEEETIQLKPLPKVISEFRDQTRYITPKPVLVGFKLLVNSEIGELVSVAQESQKKNQCDLVVANDLRDIKANDHRLILVTKKDTRFVYTDKKDPNYLAREVVNKFTWLYSHPNARYYSD